MLKKAIKLEGLVVVSEENVENKFPPGFSYRIEGIIYTVRENVSQNAHEQMRRVTTSAGDTEIMLIETIAKDLKEHGCEILSNGEIIQEDKKEDKIDNQKETKDEKK